MERDREKYYHRMNAFLQECTPQPCKVQKTVWSTSTCTYCRQPNFINFSFLSQTVFAYSIQHCCRCGFHFSVAVLSNFIFKHCSLITISTSLLHIVHVVLMFCLFECHVFVKKQEKDEKKNRKQQRWKKLKSLSLNLSSLPQKDCQYTEESALETIRHISESGPGKIMHTHLRHWLNSQCHISWRILWAV